MHTYGHIHTHVYIQMYMIDIYIYIYYIYDIYTYIHDDLICFKEMLNRNACIQSCTTCAHGNTPPRTRPIVGCGRPKEKEEARIVAAHMALNTRGETPMYSNGLLLRPSTYQCAGKTLIGWYHPHEGKELVN